MYVCICICILKTVVGGHRQSPVLDSGKKLWEKSLAIHFVLTHAPHHKMMMMMMMVMMMMMMMVDLTTRFSYDVTSSIEHSKVPLGEN